MDLISVFRQKYSVHPLIFQRSLERAKSAGDLFDILETFPEQHPVIWNDEQRRWLPTDLLQEESLT